MTWDERFRAWLPAVIGIVLIGVVLWLQSRTWPPLPPTPEPTPQKPLSMPDEVAGPAGTFLEVKPKVLGGAKITFFTPPGQHCEHRVYEDHVLLVGQADGVYWVGATVVQNDRAIEPLWTKIRVGKPPPGPGPKPDPPSPAPIPVAGFRVLIVYESSALGTYPKGQAAILSSTLIRDYLSQKCVLGPDGKTREWRVLDQNVDSLKDSSIWSDALKRPRTGLPWIIISDGSKGFEGLLPLDIDKTLDLLKKYSGG